MDNVTATISDLQTIGDLQLPMPARVPAGWRPRSLTSTVSAAQPLSADLFAERIAPITKQHLVMGGYVVDDTFGNPRGSRPDRPPV